jgi:hypothetical protein
MHFSITNLAISYLAILKTKENQNLKIKISKQKRNHSIMKTLQKP